MKPTYFLSVLFFIQLGCDNPAVDPSTYQEIFLEKNEITLTLPNTSESIYNVQVLLNTRTNSERINLILKGDAIINNQLQEVTVDVVAELSSLTLNTDFSYSFIIEETTPIKTLVNCDKDNPYSNIEELPTYFEGVKPFQWDEENQLYFIDLEVFNALLPNANFPSIIIYQEKGVLKRNCE